jgi:hypothetical protein
MENNINQQKLDYIISLGVDIEDYSLESTQHCPAYVVFTDDYSYSIDMDDFNIGDSLVEIESYADAMSCCGDVLDRDYMICPTCKEHC